MKICEYWRSRSFLDLGPNSGERFTGPLVLWLFNILRMDGRNLIKFWIHFIIDKIYVAIVKGHFSQICNGVTALDWYQKLVFAQYLEKRWTEFNQILYTHYHQQDLYKYYTAFFFHKCSTELRLLIDVRNWYLLNILRMDGQNLIKFCIHYIIDKIYVCIEKDHFLQICNRVMALDLCQKLFFAQYLENGWTELTKFCIYITIDMIYPPPVLQTELCSWTYLCPVIVLWRDYGQILWQF